MKKSMLFVLGMLFVSYSAQAEWTGKYELDTGLKITRKSTGVKIKSGGLNFNMKEYKFGKGSGLNKSIATDEGRLALDLEESVFRQNVKKLGNIINSKITQVNTIL